MTKLPEVDIKKIIDMNSHLLLMMGFAIATINECKKLAPSTLWTERQEKAYTWLLQAVENVAYRGKEPPILP